MTSYSVVIPSYNSHDTIGGTLDSLERQTRSELLREIIVVDSSEDRRTERLLEARRNSMLRIIRLETRTVPGEGRNIGARDASGGVLVFLDSDVILDANWLEEVDRAYRHGCQAGSGSVSLPDSQGSSLIARVQLYLQLNEYLPAGRTRAKDVLPSCNMFCERGLYQATGGFPDLRASEDVAFFLILNRIDESWFVPSARCRHVFRTRWRPFFRYQSLLGRYVAISRRTYRPGPYLARNWIWLTIPGVLLIKAIRVTLRIVRAGLRHLLAYVLVFPLFLVGLVCWGHGFVHGCRCPLDRGEDEG